MVPTCLQRIINESDTPGQTGKHFLGRRMMDVSSSRRGTLCLNKALRRSCVRTHASSPPSRCRNFDEGSGGPPHTQSATGIASRQCTGRPRRRSHSRGRSPQGISPGHILDVTRVCESESGNQSHHRTGVSIQVVSVLICITDSRLRRLGWPGFAARRSPLRGKAGEPVSAPTGRIGWPYLSTTPSATLLCTDSDSPIGPLPTRVPPGRGTIFFP